MVRCGRYNGGSQVMASAAEQAFHQQLVDQLGIGLALGRPHHGPHQRADGLAVAVAHPLRRIGVVRDDRVHDPGELIGVADLLQAPGGDDLARRPSPSSTPTSTSRPSLVDRVPSATRATSSASSAPVSGLADASTPRSDAQPMVSLTSQLTASVGPAPPSTACSNTAVKPPPASVATCSADRP